MNKIHWALSLYSWALHEVKLRAFFMWKPVIVYLNLPTEDEEDLLRWAMSDSKELSVDRVTVCLPVQETLTKSGRMLYSRKLWNMSFSWFPTTSRVQMQPSSDSLLPEKCTQYTVYLHQFSGENSSCTQSQPGACIFIISREFPVYFQACIYCVTDNLPCLTCHFDYTWRSCWLMPLDRVPWDSLCFNKWCHFHASCISITVDMFHFLLQEDFGCKGNLHLFPLLFRLKSWSPYFKWKKILQQSGIIKLYKWVMDLHWNHLFFHNSTLFLFTFPHKTPLFFLPRSGCLLLSLLLPLHLLLSLYRFLLLLLPPPVLALSPPQLLFLLLLLLLLPPLGGRHRGGLLGPGRDGLFAQAMLTVIPGLLQLIQALLPALNQLLGPVTETLVLL